MSDTGKVELPEGIDRFDFDQELGTILHPLGRYFSVSDLPAIRAALLAEVERERDYARKDAYDQKQGARVQQEAAEREAARAHKAEADLADFKERLLGDEALEAASEALDRADTDGGMVPAQARAAVAAARNVAADPECNRKNPSQPESCGGRGEVFPHPPDDRDGYLQAEQCPGCPDCQPNQTAPGVGGRRRDRILALVAEGERAGVSSHALAPVREYAANIDYCACGHERAGMHGNGIVHRRCMVDGCDCAEFTPEPLPSDSPVGEER